jgi:hypothetical protein
LRLSASELIIFGPLTDPLADGISVADGKLLLSMRHVDLGRSLLIQQQHQIAHVRITGLDHRAVLRTFDHAIIGGQIKPALFITFPTRLMTLDASAFKGSEKHPP